MALSLPPPPWIVGHRGAAGEAPENTLESLLLAVEQGADMVEVDLQLSADGVLVASHDWSLERMGGVDVVVESVAAEAIARHDVSGAFAEEGVVLPVPTLGEILERLPKGVPLDLEIKRRLADPERLARALAEALAGRGQVLVSSFDHELLAAVRAALPDCPLAPIGRRRPDDLLAAADRLGAWSVHCRHNLVGRRFVDAVAATGRPVLAYTVDDAATARRFLDLGVAGVFTDFPGRLRRELDRSP